MTRCPFGDPFCPCPEGNACHYRDYPGSQAMQPPPVFHAAVRVAKILNGVGIFAIPPTLAELSGASLRLWLACLDVARELTEKKP